MRHAQRTALTTLALTTLLTWSAPMAAADAPSRPKPAPNVRSLEKPAEALDYLSASLRRLLNEARNWIRPDAPATPPASTRTGPGMSKVGCEIDPYGDGG